jgi:hypothetical protein
VYNNKPLDTGIKGDINEGAAREEDARVQDSNASVKASVVVLVSHSNL